MNSKFKTVLFITIIVVLIIACSRALYMPTLADAQKTGVSIDSLSLGRKLYINDCGSCHSLYQPERFTKKDWGVIMTAMQKKAKCSDQETAIIMNYINAQ